jgi:MSHA pilin protein MshC
MDRPDNQSTLTPLISGTGFTLIELIVVMVLMAILAAVAAPRFMGRGDFEQPAFVQELAAAARYAQKLAVTSGCPVRLSLTSATAYELLQPLNAPPPCSMASTRSVLHPGTGAEFSGTAPAGVTMSTVQVAGVGVAFPVSVDFAASGGPAAGDVEIPVGSQSVVISAGSGYVDIQ